MGLILGIHYKTIKEYTDILEKNKLIKIEINEPEFIEVLANGKPKFTRATNHYEVRFKYDSEHKYYLDIYFNSLKEKED